MVRLNHRRAARALLWAAVTACAAGASASAAAAESDNRAGNALKSFDYSVRPGNRIEMRFELAEPVAEPRTFTIRDPARIALDFDNTRNATGKRQFPIDVGIANSLNLVEAQGRTRAVVNLTEVTQFNISVEGNVVRVSLGQRPDTSATQASTEAPDDPKQAASTGATAASTGQESTARGGLEGVEFRRGDGGQGRVLLNLAAPDVTVDVQQQGGNVVVTLPETTIPPEQRRRLDVLDFATPVKYIDIDQRGSTGRIEIVPQTQQYRQIAFQSEDQLTVELKPLTEEQAAEREEEKEQYTGDKLSLNFQQIAVRSVLQLLADFTGLNIVVSDSVEGNLTLRLKEVPWDQALDIILQSEGLDKRRNGNVIFVAPRKEIAAREQAKLEAQNKQQELAPLRTEYIQVNYAKAQELAAIIQSEDSSLVSDRASVTVDQRTNTLLIQATSESLSAIRQLVERLDVPVRQVLIESRIVTADDDFNKELGVRFGVNRDTTNDGDGVVFSGDSEGTSNLIDNEDLEDERFNVNLPATGAGGTAGLALAELPFGTLLELELSAMQAEGRGEVISTPRVITSNQQEASIEQGTEIPFQEASASGATSVSFEDAVLELNVTPQITPDGRVIMDLEVKKDEVGQVFQGVPSIDTQAVQTQVLVDNGETVVLGGIYEKTTRKDVQRVPFFGELPVVGALFRNTRTENDKSELLIFVTPQIIEGGTGIQQ